MADYPEKSGRYAITQSLSSGIVHIATTLENGDPYYFLCNMYIIKPGEARDGSGHVVNCKVCWEKFGRYHVTPANEKEVRQVLEMML